MKARGRRYVRRPPDLTSLFDVLFLVVFVALIRAAAAQHEVDRLTPPPPPPRPAQSAPPPRPPPAVAALRAQALSELGRELAARTPLVVRVATHLEGDRIRPTIAALELEGRRLALDVPLLADSRDPDVESEYLGARSAELHVCRAAAVQLRLPDLSRHLVVIVVDRARAELERLPGSQALLDGLAADVTRCFVEQQGVAALIDPAEMPAPAPAPVPAPARAHPPTAPSPP